MWNLKNKLIEQTTWMDLEGIMLSEISQTEKDKYHMISFTCGSKEKNKQIKKTKTDLVPGQVAQLIRASS